MDNPLGWDDWDLPRDVYEGIGRVAVACNLLDQMLREIVAGLLGTDLGRVMSAGESTSSLIDKCKRLTAYRDGLADSDAEELLAALRQAADLSEQRNHVVHATWLATSDLPRGQRLARRSRRRAPLHSQEPWSGDRLAGLERELRDVVVDLHTLFFRLLLPDYDADRRAEMRDEPRGFVSFCAIRHDRSAADPHAAGQQLAPLDRWFLGC
jgi:hypothetical protein